MSECETDRFVTPMPLPTPHERELVTILAEECGEVIVRATKLLRFGADEIQPGQELPFTNRQRLAHEIGDVIEMVDRLVRIGLVEVASIEAGRARKRKNLSKYMQTEPACNTPNCQESHE